MAINKTLKFSWGHIIAFIALIFISYVSFMGITYFTDGNFQDAGLGVFIINMVLIVFFIIPQRLKAADVKFGRKIIFERLLLFLSPFFFVATMVPYSHFWTVFEKRMQVETIFSESITATKGMFDSYEEYANKRIGDYDAKLLGSKTKAQSRANKVDALKLQLIADNYDALKENAFEWIDNAEGATIWNVFLIGNIKKIEGAIESWNISLNEFSEKIMTDEPEGVEPYTSSVPGVVAAKEKLDSLRSFYTRTGMPTALAIGIAVLLYLMLLLPYIIQSRNPKSVYRLVGSEGGLHSSRSKKTNKSNRVERQDCCMDDSESSAENAYGSFEM